MFQCLTAIESPITFQSPPLFKDGEITNVPRGTMDIDHLLRIPDTNSAIFWIFELVGLQLRGSSIAWTRLFVCDFAAKDYIDQQLPLSVDDDQLRPGCGMDSTESGPPITSAPVAQFKFNEDLSEWREPISYLLDTVGSSAFLSGHVQENGSGRLRQEEIRKNVQLCVDAATKITKHVNYINEAGELYSTLFIVPYYGFSAVVILYVFATQRRTETPETCMDCFRLASQCHAQIGSIATNGSLMQRYGVVLQELRLEVLRNNTCLAPISNPRAGNCLTSNENNEILPVPYRRSQLRPEGGTSGSRLAVEQAAEGAPFCRSFPCFSRRTLQHDKLGTIRFIDKSQVGLEILMRWFTTTPPIFGATAATINRENGGVRGREIPGAWWREYRAQIICVEGKRRKSRVDMRPPPGAWHLFMRGDGPTETGRSRLSRVKTSWECHFRMTKHITSGPGFPECKNIYLQYVPRGLLEADREYEVQDPHKLKLASSSFSSRNIHGVHSCLDQFIDRRRVLWNPEFRFSGGEGFPHGLESHASTMQTCTHWMARHSATDSFVPMNWVTAHKSHQTVNGIS
ncbi:finger protein [Colletotrichum lupini]|uniref:Finger protein n=1 Tax=Colletotrichum lupini TaxID=145971 RepID=A0A9Q8SX09_9PEZI|nr:finger protein [Colletotrichum lupini]UQC84281.1 finger protein [Colletotrichum lupini]